MIGLSRYIAAAGDGRLTPVLQTLYGPHSLDYQRQRVQGLLRSLEKWSGDAPCVLVTAPGRTELGGNHTDHNHGIVLAAAIDFDCLAVATKTSTGIIRIKSKGFPGIIEVDIHSLAQQKEEQGTSAALIRGIAYGFNESGYEISSFDACISGDVPIGAGLSSSAAFEICIGQIFNHLCNDGNITPLELARIGREAENTYFGKPCGLMDQLTCAKQGIVSIDFEDPIEPKVAEIETDFDHYGYQLAVVDTGGNHADLTPDYAAIPEEMYRAAAVLGYEFARGLTLDQVMESAALIRKEAGDRALLRLIHFIEETERATHQADCLRNGDIQTYLEAVNASGDSSWRLLQNCVSLVHPLEQNIPIALVMTQRFLKGVGAWRIQGGGFAGTIQTYVPKDRFPEYKTFMETIFGTGAVVPLRVRKSGIDLLLPDLKGATE